MATIERLIELLKSAQGDPQAQAAITAGFLVSAQPEPEREDLRAALDAAAVLRWFDASLLARVLQASQASKQFDVLKSLPFVECYGVHAGDRRNVHESTRLGWRKRLADEAPERFRVLSARAAACFADDASPTGQIEWIYQLLCGDPDRGATELEELDREWSSLAHPEDRYALAVAIEELEDTKLVQGRARVWVLLVVAWAHRSRGETSWLVDVARDALRLAHDASDSRAEADAQSLLGDVFSVQGRLAEALAAYGEYLTISRRLVEQDPSNADWQGELAVAYSSVADVLKAQGKLLEALAAIGECLSIIRRLAKQDPSNACWQRGLALALSREGDMLQAKGNRGGARAAYGEYLATSRQLAERDPTNADWQCELAAAYGRIGNALKSDEMLTEARAAYGEYLAIGRQLAERDPGNADWQCELAVAFSKVGEVLATQGKLTEAKAMFGESLGIFRRLAEKDPTNAGWLHDLAVANLNSAKLESEAGRRDAALPLYKEASRIYRALMKMAPGFTEWAREKEMIDSDLELLLRQA